MRRLDHVAAHRLELPGQRVDVPVGLGPGGIHEDRQVLPEPEPVVHPRLDGEGVDHRNRFPLVPVCDLDEDEARHEHPAPVVEGVADERLEAHVSCDGRGIENNQH